MGFFRTDEMEYRLLHLCGGSVHGISQAQLIIFLEDVAGIPVGWQYDMVSGDSIGSGGAAALTCPKEKGSKKPKMSARQYEAELVRLCLETFEPFQEKYYERMVKLEIELRTLEETINIINRWACKRDKAIQNTIDKALDSARAIMRKTGLQAALPPEQDPEQKQAQETRLSARFNLHSGITTRTIIPVLGNLLERAKKKAASFFFSTEAIYKSFDHHLTFADGSPVMLSDTITGFHSDAFNINRKQPESHVHILPIGTWKGFISHHDLPLADIPKRSMPAQTVFKPYLSPYSGYHYDDIAHYNTMASPMNDIRRKFSKAQDNRDLRLRIKRHGMSIGTGVEGFQIDPERMGELLLLGRMDPSEGAPLMKIPLLFNTTKAVRDLKEELGAQHAIFIDKVVEKDQPYDKGGYKRLLERYNEASALTRAHMLETLGQPIEFSLIDARPEKIEQLRQFGWAMVWDHLEVLVNEAKAGLYRAHRNGLISDRHLERRLKFIENNFPPEKMNAPDRRRVGFIEYLTSKGHLPGLGLGLFASSATGQPEIANDHMTPPPNDDSSTAHNLYPS